MSRLSSKTKTKIQRLLDNANATTGKSDSDLTTAQASLIEGYGQGGGGTSEIILQNKTFTENGTYSADSGYDGLGTVNVNVDVKLQEKTVTENGTITPDSGYDGLSKVNVNVGGGIVFKNINDNQSFDITASVPTFLCTVVSAVVSAV